VRRNVGAASAAISRALPRAQRLLQSLFIAGALTACATNPEPLPEDTARERLADLEALFNEQEPIESPLTLADAMARAIKYNVDARVELMSKALAQRDLDLSKVDLLPALTVSAGYRDRSNVNAFSSESIITGQQSLEPSTSEEQERTEADATLVWNALDFGVSYVSAQQRSDTVLIAEERRRKAIQNIIQDVNFAYWQALAAQTLGPELEILLLDMQKQLEDTEAAQQSGALDPRRGARDRDTLLTALRELTRLRNELALARRELTRLMNVKPGTDFTLEPMDEEMLIPVVEPSPSEVEQTALTHRPELREEDYRKRIDVRDVRKAILRMLPGLEIELGAAYDSNDFLVNNDWTFAGVRIVWNLFNVLSGPRAKAAAEARVGRDDLRRMALSMAVLAQLHVAYERLRTARAEYDITSRLASVNERIVDQQRARRNAAAADAMTETRARARAFIAALQKEQAFAELQNAAGRIQNSIGLDPMPKAVESHDVEALAGAIARHQKALDMYLASPASACRDGDSCPEAGADNLALF
jgi:outer membrane protein TolC